MDATGKLVKTVQNPGSTISVADLAPGLYSVVITAEEGLQAQRKLVIAE